MKNSGVEWLGDVPAHWDMRRLRTVADMRVSNVDKHVKAEEVPVRLCNYVDVYKNDHINEQISFMRATATGEEIERFRLAKGDVLITKDSEAWNDIGVPALVTNSTSNLVSGYHLALLRPYIDEILGEYLLRTFQSKGLAHQFSVKANGVTRYGLTHAAIKSVRLPLPSLIEQTAIVRYLDYVEQRVQRLVRAKQKLIELLKEQKQAIIHRAVTRGLDPNVPRKDSGVEWLGEVPKHWEVQKIRTLFRQHGSGTTPADNSYYEGEIPWVMTGDLNDGDVDATKRTVNSSAIVDISALRLYPPGSLLVAMYGATIGKTGVLCMEACTNQACCVLAEPTQSTNVHYLQAVVNLARSSLVEQSYGGGQPNINSEIVKALRVPVPPQQEQNEIVEAIDQTYERIAIARARREVELLQEYRTRLIADVVTGKVDVRSVKLPDDADETGLTTTSVDDAIK